ncbi:MAG: histidine kinase, partial [Verrucomicrobia bacterium]|nr:histidine kinase [Verrucomicrobiota bacterium]
GGFHPAGLKTRDGQLWFSTTRGLVKVDPAKISLNSLPPPVRLQEILADGVVVYMDGEDLRAAPVAATAPFLKLKPGVQRMEFRFSALSLTAPERNRFRYRLEGLEQDWIDAGAQRLVAYPGLPPGRYEFQVRASNNDGVWNETGATVRFQMLPHFWQTWGFRALALAILLGVVGWMARRFALHRLDVKMRRLREEHAVERERTRIAQDIHDELGATLTRIALLTEVGLKHQDKPAEVTAALGKISSTAREAVQAMDAIVWAVNPHNDSLDHFANYVSQYAEEFLRPTSIRCRLDIPADLPEHQLPTECRHQLFLSVKEALNNVVRHSGATEVWLRLGLKDGELRIIVADNGRGMAPASDGAGSHDGLGNIRKRVESLGGTLQIRSGPPSGTELSIQLPLPGKEGRAA